MGPFEKEVEKLIDADAPSSEEEEEVAEVWVLRTKMKPYRYAKENPVDKDRFSITYNVKKAKLFTNKIQCMSWAQKVHAVDNFEPDVVVL